MKKIVNILNVGLFVILMAFVGCNKDNMNTHQDEHHHEAEFSKVEFIFTEGHTHGSSFHGDAAIEGVKYLKNQQKITYTFVNNKWEASTETPIRFRRSSHYGLEIIYYNAEGKRINSEIIEEADTHQHFFQIEKVTPIKSGVVPADVNTLLTYMYRDTNPENEYYRGSRTPGVRLFNNPVGLKGYFEVKEQYVAFNLKVTLAHFLASGEKKVNGAYRPYNQLPSASIAPSDFQVSIPVRVFTDRLNTNEQELEQDLMDEFNITQEEAEAEFDAILEGDIDPESSTIWM